MLKELILATKNKHKTVELGALLEPLGIKVLNALDFPNLPDVVEDGLTLQDNALKKARTIAQITGIPTLADDTGLLVDALNGNPGVFSARYAGENATYDENVTKLLMELSVKGEFPFSARFETVLAFIWGGKETCLKGVCEGKIIHERKGEKGFGYDPIFVPDGFTETFAELSSPQKNAISHRGKAMNLFIELVEEFQNSK